MLHDKPYFKETFFKELTPAVLDDSPTAAFTADLGRITNVLESAAYGLYSDKFGERWPNLIHIHLVGMFRQESLALVQSPQDGKLLQAADARLKDGEKLGENPTVFYYQVHRVLEKAELLIKMVFYGGFEALAISSPKVPA